MRIRGELLEVFSECEHCRTLVPCRNYCVECGKRQYSGVEIRKLGFNEVVKCFNCGSVVMKGTHCSECGFILNNIMED